MSAPVLTAAALLALSCPGCGALGFDVDQDLPEQVVQGDPLGGLLPGFIGSPFPLAIDVEAETRKRNTGPASSANLGALRFAVLPHDQPTGNFDFLDEVHIFIAASGSNLAPREIARLAPVPKGKTLIDLDITPGIDLLPYINAGARISSQASGHQPSMTLRFDGHVTVAVRI